MVRAFAIAIAAALLLAACQAPAPPVEPAPEPQAVAVPATGVIAAGAQAAQAVAADTALPVALATAEAVAEALPPSANPAPDALAHVAGTFLVRHEVISPAYYSAKLQRASCPGDISGPTIGVGYDLGMQTRPRIATDWQAHPRVDVLPSGSGVTGFGPCRAWRSAHADVRTPYDLAAQVFESASLPAYTQLTARTFRDGWDRLPVNAQASLVATVYARGAGMTGRKRGEMRQLRDVCVPAADVDCMAQAYRAMCAVFAGRADSEGLCNRFRATAELAVRA